MIRTLLWLLAGAVLGGIIHIAVILSLPALSATSAWDQVAAVGTGPGPTVLPAATPNAPNPLRLDPELTYAVCRIDLRLGPASVGGTLPQAFWSVAVYSRAGTVVYSTTNRDGVGTALDLGIFNPAQTRLLAEQKLDVAEGLLIVEAREDDLFVVVRLAPPHPEMRARYEKALGNLKCGTIAT
ncbi:MULTISPECIES: hypothetical protein [unclassified Devosia]|uniref:DUF1254 domain-containing protein n=1 Tax=unclassified Devosia TaxID=196773 RepID=UPI00086F0907|nr:MULTISPECIES: hypothetical protein [unclassified Devosia]MBN9360371.1 hypothetical protein [Devosia sp.]ODS96025.1 MAG: hypothetical protein ABS47_02015 [Devosia sp. SCN 66-27]OJX22384.1 MAG: hypothetical protein BGO83_16280 [Devosia sp. 66-14]